MSASPGEKFRFVSQSAAEEAFHVVRFSGTEGLNSLYRFEIVLATEHLVSVDGLLTKPAELVLLREGKSAVFSGYLSSATQTTHYNGYTFYTVVLQPKFWKLTQIRQTRIYLDKAVEDLVGEAIKVDEVFRIKTRFNLLDDYPTSEFTLQYDESVYDYIANKLEYEGVYYYFEQGDAATDDSSERVVFTDSHLGHEPLGETPSLRYSPVSGLEAAHAEEVVTAFALGKTPLPRKVVLRAYDWMHPNEPLIVEAQVSPRGLGEVYYSDNRFVTREEGKRLARIRAEELACRGTTFTGVSAVPTLRPGYQFTLENHYDDTFNTSYLITGITHEGSQEAYLASALGLRLEKGDDHHYYRNTFTAILADTPFRPARVTARAKVQGVMTAFIDGAGKGDTPEIDEHGRYKVVFAFDMSGRKQGNASCWLRMSQPHVGKGFGTAFPLTPGVEVTVTFVEGDPDRPLISGALANTETGPLVSNTNTSLSGMTTGKGSSLLFSEKGGKGGMSLATASGRSMFSMQSGSSEAKISTTDMALEWSKLAHTAYGGVSKTAWTAFRESKVTGLSFKTIACNTIVNSLNQASSMCNAFAAEDKKNQGSFQAGALVGKTLALLVQHIVGVTNILKDPPYKYSISAKAGCTKALHLTGPTKGEALAYVLASVLGTGANVGGGVYKASNKPGEDKQRADTAADAKRVDYLNYIKKMITRYKSNTLFDAGSLNDMECCQVINEALAKKIGDEEEICNPVFPAIRAAQRNPPAGETREGIALEIKKLSEAYDYVCCGGYEQEKADNTTKYNSSKVSVYREVAFPLAEALVPEIIAMMLTFGPLLWRLKDENMGGILFDTDSNIFSFSKLDTMVGSNKRIFLAAGSGTEASLNMASSLDETQIDKFIDPFCKNIGIPEGEPSILLSAPHLGMMSQDVKLHSKKTHLDSCVSISISADNNESVTAEKKVLELIKSNQENQLKKVEDDLKEWNSIIYLAHPEKKSSVESLEAKKTALKTAMGGTKDAQDLLKDHAVRTRAALDLKTDIPRALLHTRGANATLRLERSSHGDDANGVLTSPVQYMELTKEGLTLTHQPAEASTATIALTGAIAAERAIELAIGACKAILTKDSITLKLDANGDESLTMKSDGMTIKSKELTLNIGGEVTKFTKESVNFSNKLALNGGASAKLGM